MKRSLNGGAAFCIAFRMAFCMALLVSLAAAGSMARAAENDLEKGFIAPPDSARPWVYWFWLDGNITREGVTADLEAMKRVGVGGVLIMEVDQGAPKGPARFGGPEWRELFKLVCSEANRLGLQVNMNNDAGWCGSGGPWITPELSMQRLVWTETAVEGPKRVEVALPKPQAVKDYYKDIAVFAFPAPAGEGAKMADASPKITASAEGKDFDAKKLMDDNPRTAITLPRPESGKPQSLLLEFAQPYTASSLMLAMGGGARDAIHGALQTSVDGRAFKTVREFDVKPPALAANFEETSSRFFRILFTRADAKLDKLTVGSVDLSRRYRIEGIEGKSSAVTVEINTKAVYPTLPAAVLVPRSGVVEVTNKMGADGRFVWDAPEGKWVVLRMGCTTTGKDNHPSPLEGRGLECDKLSKEAADAMFNGLMGKLIADSKSLAGETKTLVSTHIDSWEVGSQNWTPRFREEFKRLRGYDPFPYFPVMTGRVAESLEVSERFLWDIRQTVSDLLVENYAGRFRELARKNGIRLSIEAYGAPCDELTYGGQADEPMAEFWSWAPYGAAYSCTEMASSAHVYGKKILGAEAFTATNAEKWLGHPANIKVYGDWAFCEGINRFVFHRYALQPWKDRRPGMSMGPWGLHYERSTTWWEQSVAWHEYLSRCQYLLQQGLFVADICALQAEGAPRRFIPPATVRPGGVDRGKYNFDGCSPEVILTRMKAKDGRLTLPDGMSYRLLVLPDAETMTPSLLRKIKSLVEDGVTVVGPRPLKSPSLSDYPKCDDELKKLADELWGDCDGKTVKEHRCGKGKVAWGKTPDELLTEMGIGPDFIGQGKKSTPGLRYIHKSIDGTEAYFVANKNPRPEETVCAFRIKGMRPEIWRPDLGTIERTAVYDESDGYVRVPISFEPYGSAFVVFRPSAATEADRIVSVARDGEALFDLAARKEQKPQAGDNNQKIANTFTMAVWAKPDADTPLPKETNAGVIGLNDRRNDALYAAPGHEVYTEEGQAGAGVSVGKNGVCVNEHGANYFAPVLVYAAPINAMTHVAVVYKDGVPSLYLDGKLVRKGLKGSLIAHPSVGVAHTRAVAPFKGELGAFQIFDRALAEAEIAELMKTMTRPAAELPSQTAFFEITRGKDGAIEALVGQAGKYALKTADGKSRQFEAPAIPAPLEIAGSWELHFAPSWGAPEKVTLEKLISWSEHSEAGVKYFSGAATYIKTLSVPANLIAKDRRLYLDLGKVQVMAEVKLNGKNLGILWKPPYRVDVTEAVKAGDNALEVKVVNLWINRQIGDEQLPEDSERNATGTLKEWPKWLEEGKPSPTGRFAFTSWRLWKKGDPLQESGLLGPVTLQTAQRIEVK